MSENAPAWFTSALEVTATSRTFELQDTLIHYRHWQRPDLPGLLLVHGHAAHSHWWDFIAPALTEAYDVVAIDRSGSGDSGHRAQYSAALFAEEIVTCLDVAGLKTPTVVGHSFGGSMTRIAAHLYPSAISSIVLVDSAIPVTRGERTPPPMPRTKTRYYPSLDQGKRRFRLRPPQPCENQYIIDHIAAHSLKRSAEGYSFKLDPAVFAKMPTDNHLPVASEMIAALPMPVGLIYGEHSRFFPPEFVRQLDRILDPTLVTRVDDAHHHVFLDQPLAFTAALKALLQQLSR